METFKTASGMELGTDYFVHMDNPPYAYIRVFDKTIVECATIFSNPEETKHLEYYDDVIEGYTNLCGISNNDDAIMVQLSK